MENLKLARMTGIPQTLSAVKSGLALISKLTTGFDAQSPKKYQNLTANSAINQDWQKIGNDMRIGILKYDQKQSFKD